jgi:transposase-like protein
MSGEKVVNRYSLAFKQKVVSDIESGKLYVYQAQKLYDIAGGATIPSWIKKLGKNHLLAKVIRIEMQDEPSKLKFLERQKRELESALAQAHVKLLSLESLIVCVEDHYHIDVKKTFGTTASSTPARKPSSKRPAVASTGSAKRTG